MFSKICLIFAPTYFRYVVIFLIWIVHLRSWTTTSAPIMTARFICVCTCGFTPIDEGQSAASRKMKKTQMHIYKFH